jgi:hypothetical protein
VSETTIVCPKCHHAFALTAAMSAGIETRLRAQVEADASRRQAGLDAREKAIADKAAGVERAKATVDEQIAARLAAERTKLAGQFDAERAKLAEQLQAERAAITAGEAKKARDAIADEIAKARADKLAIEQLLKERDVKLAESQKKELELLRQQRALEDAKRELELSVERRLQEESDKLREHARKESDEQNRLKIAEKEKTITDLQSRLQEAVRKAEQGSQQLQGEVHELELEALLRAKFPRDTIEPVAKGQHGGDVLQRVMGPNGQVCGSILWECKRTKNWSDGWLTKLRDDHRVAKADVAVLVSHTMPKDVDTFTQLEGVWVSSTACAIPVAMALRHSLIELSMARQAAAGQQSKIELVYDYLTGPRFRHRVEAIVEAFTTMQDDLEKERRAITRQWEKRAAQIDRVMHATVGMYGDLQGIAGKNLQEIAGMDLKLLAEDQ